MIIWINGTYGVGKTEVAKRINELYNKKSKIIDPDQLWLESIKEDRTIIFGGGYPQNTEKFLRKLQAIINSEINNYDGLLIIPMTVSESLSYDILIKNKSVIKHFILTAEESIIMERIEKDSGRDKSFALNNLKNNVKFYKTIKDAIFIDTSNKTIDETALYILNSFIFQEIKGSN